LSQAIAVVVSISHTVGVTWLLQAVDELGSGEFFRWEYDTSEDRPRR
jgi:hypothetical protein